MPSTGFPGAAAGIECQIDLPSPPWTRCLTSTQPAEAEALPGAWISGVWTICCTVLRDLGIADVQESGEFRCPFPRSGRRRPFHDYTVVEQGSCARCPDSEILCTFSCSRAQSIPIRSRTRSRAHLNGLASNTRRGPYSCLNMQASGTEGRQEPNARKRRCSRPGSRHDQALERTPLVHRRNWCLAPNCIPLEAAP
jgi:hypothetical protein